MRLLHPASSLGFSLLAGLLLLSHHQVTAGSHNVPLNDAGLVTAIQSSTSVTLDSKANDTKPAPPDLSIHKPGWCAFGQDGSCGSKSFIPIPCASPSPAKPILSNEALRSSLASVCNITDYTHSCCDETSLSKLQDSLAQASAFIALCPACADSFRKYYCEFTCSPDQSTFINITSTQVLQDSPNKGDVEAIKSIDFYVNPTFGRAFFEACKNVKFAATNGYAMEFIGGNAQNWLEFVRYMGMERPGLGSPFQINFPELLEDGDDATAASISYPLLAQEYTRDGVLLKNVSTSQAIPTPEGIQPLNPPILNCADSCACADCPARCLSLPPLPDANAHCHIGKLTCGSFFLILAYSILLLSFILGIGIRDLWARRHDILNSGSSVLGGNKQGRVNLNNNATGDYGRLDLNDPNENEDDEDGLNMTSTIDPSSSRWRRKLSSFMRRSESDLHNNNTQGQSEASSRSTAHHSSSRTGTGRRGDSESNSQRLGRGASLLSPDILASYSQPRTYRLNNILSSGFYKLGLLCAKHAYVTIIIGLVVCGALNAGWSRFSIEKDPVRLWVEKGSELATQKQVFEEEFGPFYRTEQIFLSRKTSTPADNKQDNDESTQGPILDWPTLQWWAGIEAEIRTLTSPMGTKLSDICFAPTASSDDPSQRTADDCTVQSFMGYFKNKLDKVNEENWSKELDYCARTPTACLSSAGQPLNPKLLFGGPSVARGISEQEKESGLMDMSLLYTSSDVEAAEESSFKASQAEAIVITYVLDNSLDSAKVQKAAEWERTLRSYLQDLSAKTSTECGITLSFSTEVSLEEELNKSTNTDVPIVVLSYLVMFFYVSLSLGGTGEGIVFLVWALLLRGFHSLAGLVKGRRGRSGPISLGDDVNASYTRSLTRGSVSAALRTIFVDSKFTLGLVGIAIVLLSVSTSVGIFSLCGVKVTLIIAEVIPFLVLAIGVDNVFILLHELQRQNARAYQNVRAITGPGGLHPALLAVGGGTSTGYDDELLDEEEEGFDESDLPSAEERIARALGRMGPSILLSASCQTVAFGLGAAVGMPAVRNFAIYAAGAVAINAMLQITVFVAFMTLDLKRIESSRVDCFPCVKLGSSRDRLFAHQRESVVIRFIRSIYAPFLLKRKVKLSVMAIFSGLFVASWICTDYINLGLDQRLALPRNSYLVNYFNDLDNYLQVGPPVYFVEQGLDLTHREAQQQVCGRFSTCSEYSIGNLLEAERKRPSSSYLAEPPSIWLDDFFQWLNPALSGCCRVKKRDPTTFCRPEESEFACKACFEDRENEWNITMEGLPEGEEFMKYLEHWLQSPANEDCPLGGKAGYSSAVSISSPDLNDENDKRTVKASHFRTYHTPLKSQKDFINALAQAKRISADLQSKSTDGKGNIFPYSIFYVYFEQYASIVTTTRAVLALALLAVLAVTAVILGSWRTGFVVVITVFMIAMNVLGIMGIWHISLNAISLVNLLISIGIGVEFCSHIARAFMGAGSGGGAGLPHSHPAGEKERDDRAYASLVDVGSSVFSGITMTKLIGISVLALTKSKLLEVYYFRMWLTLIISGALHGLVFLPVALSFHGGQGFSLFGQEEEEYIAEIARYRGRPFFAADEDEDEDDEDDNQSIGSNGRY